MRPRLARSGKGWRVMLDARDKRRSPDWDEGKRRASKRMKATTRADRRSVKSSLQILIENNYQMCRNKQMCHGTTKECREEKEKQEEIAVRMGRFSWARWQ